MVMVTVTVLTKILRIKRNAAAAKQIDRI
jgi:hypothetical protein